MGRDLKSASKPDRLSQEERSQVMSSVRSSGTKVELAMQHLLSDRGLANFETNVRTLLGHPDIVFFKEHVAIFVDSDFWHGWQFPRWEHKLRNDFWRDKISSNRKRDRNVSRNLKADGWKVVRIWEHQLSRDPDEVIRRVRDALASG